MFRAPIVIGLASCQRLEFPSDLQCMWCGMRDQSDIVAVDGTAALSICEALLLALIDRGVVTASTVEELLSDVITTHSNAAAISSSPEKHQAIVQIVRNMLRGKTATTLE